MAPRRLAQFTLIGMLVVGCGMAARGCGDFAYSQVIVYNLTAEPVQFEDLWLVACDRTGFPLADWPHPSSPQISPPPGIAQLSADLGVGPDYEGDITVVVTSDGVRIVKGFIAESDLPRCSGPAPR
jgi:hypothetical protein